LRLFLSAFLCLAIPVAGLWMAYSGSQTRPRVAQAAANATAAEPHLRVGFAPETNIFAMRKGYRSLADYLEKKLAGDDKAPPVRIQLVTASSYAGTLRDFKEGRIDAAFMGSLAALVAVDRNQGQVYLKSQGSSGLSTYSGVVFVLEGSPCRSIEDLKGRRLGAVRTTMGGAVYPLYLMKQGGMLDGAASSEVPQIAWAGTHDDVINEVVAGNLDGGAVKDLRLLAYEKEHPGVKFRRLAESARAPDNALVVRRDYPAAKREALVAALLGMHEDPAGKAALEAMKVQRYVPCAPDEYSELYKMVESLGRHWSDLNIEGPAPQRPAAGELHIIERSGGD
jgi:phosphonate transport system substrate-binding protein